MITLERLFKNTYGTGLNQGIYSIADHRDRFQFLVEQVERTTGTRDFGKYMCKLFTIDAFFLNEDRHTHNISVLMDGRGRFRLCPIYDNGAALMSDMQVDYPIGCDVLKEIDRVKAKTICEDFDEQLEIAEAFCGQQIRFVFSAKDVRDILDRMQIYDEDVRIRVETLLRNQRRKYRYLFAEKG